MSLLARLALLFEPFRFFKHAREARAAEAAAMREHTIELLDAVMSRVEKREEHSSRALEALGAAMSEQARATAKWFDMFQQQSTDAHLDTSTVRPENEAYAAEQRDIERFKQMGFPIDGSLEDQLAFIDDVFG